MTATDTEILEYLLSVTKLETFNNAINGYQLQHIYSARKRDLKHRFFGGSELKCAIEMRRIFNQFQTTADEQKAKELHTESRKIKRSLRHFPKWHPSRPELIEKYNALVSEHNELCKGVEVLIKMFRKSRRNSSKSSNSSI